MIATVVYYRACVILCVLLAFACLLTSACDGTGSSTLVGALRDSYVARPIAVMPCRNAEGWLEWGQTPLGIYVVAAPDNDVTLLHWEGSGMRRRQFSVSGRSAQILPISDTRFMRISAEEEEATDVLQLRSSNGRAIVHAWSKPSYWWFSTLRLGDTGERVAVVAEENVMNSPADWDWRLDRAKLGIIDMESDDLNWVCTLTGHSILVRDVAVSSDARYLALAAYEHGIAVVDVRAKRVAWTDYPPNIVDLSFVEFAPDGRRLYAGGHDAVIFEYESASGKVSNRWCITRSGSYEPGHRIKSLAVSPDGRWIAGGLSLDGDAVLVERESGRMLRLQHGVGTVRAISFSPDSRRVATWIPGSITVWAVPDVETP
jgi:WD40 repeat protein